MLNAEGADEPQLVRGRGEQTRRTLGPQHFRRVRIEGHDHRRAARRMCIGAGPFDHRAVAAMHPIKDANGEKERPRHLRELVRWK